VDSGGRRKNKTRVRRTDSTHTTNRNTDGSKDLTIVAIDAIDFRDYETPSWQYRAKLMHREVRKAYTGFSNPNYNHIEIATGRLMKEDWEVSRRGKQEVRGK
jgi:hypothetical protein